MGSGPGHRHDGTVRASPVRSLVLGAVSLLVALVATVGALYQPRASVTLRTPAAMDQPTVAGPDAAPDAPPGQ